MDRLSPASRRSAEPRRKGLPGAAVRQYRPTESFGNVNDLLHVRQSHPSRRPTRIRWPPDQATIRPVLEAIDADAVDAAVGSWLVRQLIAGLLEPSELMLGSPSRPGQRWCNWRLRRPYLRYCGGRASVSPVTLSPLTRLVAPIVMGRSTAERS
jgi:hypothetical protein